MKTTEDTEDTEDLGAVDMLRKGFFGNELFLNSSKMGLTEARFLGVSPAPLHLADRQCLCGLQRLRVRDWRFYPLFLMTCG